jgi:hypothetical protein
MARMSRRLDANMAWILLIVLTSEALLGVVGVMEDVSSNACNCEAESRPFHTR